MPPTANLEPTLRPPQATAAHARARAANRIARLRHSRLLKITLALAVPTLITWLPTLFGHAPWPLFGLWKLAFGISVFLLIARVIQLFAVETLWLLRNRLILAYIFMGVVPVLLIAGMLALGAYLFYGQYAAYLLQNELKDRQTRIDTVNALTVRELRLHPDRAADAPDLSAYYSTYYFPRVGSGVHTYFYDANGQPLKDAKGRPLNGQPNTFGALSEWMTVTGSHGVVATPEGYAVFCFGAAGDNGVRVLTIDPLTARTLDLLADGIGEVRLAALPAADANGAQAPALTSTRPLRAGFNIFDIEIRTAAFVPVKEWNKGGDLTMSVAIVTRPSLLNDQLFNSFPSVNPNEARWPLFVLAAVGFIFLAIEILSLVIGIRLTRTITGAVHDLYTGTQHVDRGDFEHRIPVRARDQLAALEISFNTMTASIQRLLEEQRQKQRLENELSIAHEVQIQLFPHYPPRVPNLEILGRCLPARIVSGDYYDFLQLGPEQVSLALGDISGKGISAALLMATIVAAVRAYQPSFQSQPVHAGAASRGGGLLPEESVDVSPALLMERLNRHIYRSTTPEKYATLFFAVYDGARRELRYTNAGHLPPVVISSDGGLRRLDHGGMVVGLFDNVTYREDRVPLASGDLLAAWSDGITEPEDEYGTEFGEARLLELLQTNRTRPLTDIMDVVLHAVKEWSRGSEQSDDITLMLARVS